MSFARFFSRSPFRLARLSGLASVGVLAGLAGGALALAHCGSSATNVNPVVNGPAPDAIDGVPSNEKVTIPGLQKPVRVVRDKRGMLHVFARSLKDATTAQGFLAARDRAPQLELLRRAAEGRVAEYAGNLQPSLAAQDLFLRALLFRRTAEKLYASLDASSEVKQALDGYAAGVTTYFKQIRSGEAHVPNGWLAIPRDKYGDWDGAASLALARLLTFQLSYTASEEINVTALRDAVFATFRADSPDPALKARAGLPLDAIRFEPAMKVPVVPLPGDPAAPAKLGLPPGSIHTPRIPADLLASLQPTLDAERMAKEFLGRGDWSSNNWVISPAKSASGHTMVASDPHLGLPAPAVFHPIALHVQSDDPAQQLDVAGMSFAGTPGVVLGFNKHIAWGATVAVYDVNDVYLDKIHDGKVTIGGKDVAIETIDEPFDYGDGHPQTITLETIPGHGVILPKLVDNKWVARTTDTVLAVRWTGMEPTNELQAFLGLDRAKDVDEARKSVDDNFEVGAQNFVIGDDQGNIAYTTHALVPTRPAGSLAWDAKAWKGQLPCFVIPGDAGLEWNGRVDAALLPRAKNPPAGFIATANSDQYGLVFDNDPSNGPLYLSCQWDPGFRKARVDERLLAKDKLDLVDLASIQADVRSPLGWKIAKHFSAALKRASASKAGTTPAPELDLATKDPRWDDARMTLVAQLLDRWGTEGAYEAASGVVVDGDPAPTDVEVHSSQSAMVFNAAMVPLFKRVFDDELEAMQKGAGRTDHPPWRKDLQYKGLIRMLEKPEALATADASGESVLWDDLRTKDVAETKDLQLVLAMLDGLEFVTKTLGNDPDGWRWGRLHTIRFKTMVPGTDRQLSIPNTGDPRFPAGGFPRHGDEQVIDRSDPGLGGGDYSFTFDYANGPAQRFVIELAPTGPLPRNALPGGEVWQPASPHFADEAELWRTNRNAAVNFTMADVAAAAEERFDLVPAP